MICSHNLNYLENLWPPPSWQSPTSQQGQAEQFNSTNKQVVTQNNTKINYNFAIFTIKIFTIFLSETDHPAPFNQKHQQNTKWQSLSQGVFRIWKHFISLPNPTKHRGGNATSAAVAVNPPGFLVTPKIDAPVSTWNVCFSCFQLQL